MSFSFAAFLAACILAGGAEPESNIMPGGWEEAEEPRKKPTQLDADFLKGDLPASGMVSTGLLSLGTS